MNAAADTAQVAFDTEFRTVEDANRLLSLARFSATAGQVDAAVAALEWLLHCYPGNADARLVLVDLLMAKGDQSAADRHRRLARAAAHLARPRFPEPADADALAEFAEALLAADRVDEAERAAAAAVNAKPQCLPALIAKARVLRRLGRQDEAVTALTAALDHHPDAPEATLLLARMQGSMDLALRAAELMPGSAEPRVLAGRLLLCSGEPGRAAAVFCAALDVAPDDPEALEGLTTALRRLRHFEEALACARRHVAAQPESAAARVQLGRTLAATGDAAAAAETLRSAFDLEARLPGAARLLGSQLKALGRNAEAAQAYALAAAEAPADGRLHLLVGAQWQAAGHHGEAVIWFRRAAERGVPGASGRLDRAIRLRPRLAATPDDPALVDAMHRFPELTVARALSWVKLEGGEHNETWRVTADDTDYALRLGRFGHARWHRYADELHNATAAAGLGIAPEILRMDCGDGAMLSRFVRGRTLHAKDLCDPTNAARCGVLYRSLHAGPPFLGSRQPLRSIARDEGRLGDDHSRFPEYAVVRQRIAPALQALRQHRVPPVPGHFDPIAANIIDSGGELVLIDWQCSAMGDPHWELGCLAAQAGMGPEAEDALAAAYFGEREHPARPRITLSRAACCYFWFLKALVRGERGAEEAEWTGAAGRWLRRLLDHLDSDAYARALPLAKRLCCR